MRHIFWDIHRWWCRYKLIDSYKKKNGLASDLIWKKGIIPIDKKCSKIPSCEFSYRC